MEKQTLPQGFQPFTWAIALFCLPVLLWPLALLISPNLSKNPLLSDWQMNWMTVFLWVYPCLMAIVARLLFKLHQTRPPLAKKILIACGVIFYLLLGYVALVGFAFH